MLPGIKIAYWQETDYLQEEMKIQQVKYSLHS